MKIVFDSTVLIPKFRKSGPAFKLLKWFIHNVSAELVFPQIVLEEVKKNIENGLMKNISQQ
jgi:predicted nucleic acid-binding protein